VATTWTGWTAAQIIIIAKQAYGEGWSLITDTEAAVNVAIYSAWVEALATFGQTDTGLDPDAPAAHASAFNQYWGHLALYKIGCILAPASAATERFRRLADDYLKPDRLTAATVHKYST